MEKLKLEPTVICCAGGSAVFIKALDKAPSKNGMQYPFNLLLFQVAKLMHKPSSSLMGKIYMCSMVRTLLVRLCSHFHLLTSLKSTHLILIDVHPRL